MQPVRHPVGTALNILGLAGLPDDIDKWSIGIGYVTRDDRVLYLAEKAVAFAEFINQPYIRFTLLLIGFLILIWRVPAFWRFRNRVVFAWSAKVSGVVWINRARALEVMRNSRWGSLKEPQGSWSDLVGNPMKFGMSETDRARERYNSFLELSLDSFEDRNPNCVKAEDGSTLYNEAALSKFLRNAMRDEVEAEFGNIPDSFVGDD